MDDIYYNTKSMLEIRMQTKQQGKEIEERRDEARREKNCKDSYQTVVHHVIYLVTVNYRRNPLIDDPTPYFSTPKASPHHHTHLNEIRILFLRE